MYVNINYVKLLQHITLKEKSKASDFKKNIVFEDRYGCRCIFCESCVIKLQIEWDNDLQKRTRTHNENFLQLPLGLKTKKLSTIVMELIHLTTIIIITNVVMRIKTEFRDYLLINPHTDLRQIAVYNRENWKFFSQMKKTLPKKINVVSLGLIYFPFLQMIMVYLVY